MICLRSGFFARRFAAWCCLFLFAFCIDAAAQSASQNSGIQPLGTYSSSFDNINLGSLSVQYDIPLFSRKERGSGNDVTAHFVYNGGSFFGYNLGAPYFGWSLLVGNSSSTHGHLVETDTPSPCIGSPDAQNFDFAYYVIDPTGYSHRFAGNYDEDCSGLHNMPLPQPTTDNSGYMLIAANRRNYTIATPSGHRLVCSSNGIDDDDCTDTDSNGNSSHLHYAGGTLYSYSDPAGSYLNISGLGSDTDPVIVTYKDTNGTQQQVKILYQRFPVIDNGTVNAPFPTKVLYPDGSSYQFSYELSAYYPGTYTGRLSSVTVPTGGTISYTYTDGTSSCGNPHSMLVGLDRVTADGTTHYTSSITSGTCDIYTSETVVTDPIRTATYDFVTGLTGQLEVGHTIHAGTSNSDSVLESMTRCYNGMTSNCLSTTLPYAPITQIDTTTSRDGGSAGRRVEYLNSASLPTEVDEYDYGATSPTRKTLTTYASLDNYISDRVKSVVVKDSNDNTIAKTTYDYDGFSLAPSNLTNLAPISGSRGNRTSQHVWVSSSGGTLDTNWQYDDAGQVVKIQDPRLNWTSFKYDTATDSCLISTTYPLQVNGTDLSESSSCDAYTGLRSTSTDLNGVKTTYSYDSMLRSTGFSATVNSSTTNPSTVANTTIGYSWNSANRQVITTTTTATPNADQVNSKTLDAYGRVSKETLANGATVLTGYDALGRVHTVTNPYSSTSDPTYGVTTYDYDALGRSTITTKPDGSTAQYCYGNLKTDSRQSGCLSRQLSSSNLAWVDQMDESGKKWQRLTNVFGFLEHVYEDPSGLKLHTQYGYDLLGNLTLVTQSGISGDLARVRSFNYDWASRLLWSHNPETGVICYGTTPQNAPGANPQNAPATETNCTADYDGNGNLKHKTDALGIQTSYSYDALNRLTTKTYTDGTPGVIYEYDGDGLWGANCGSLTASQFTKCNTIGRLWHVATKDWKTGAVFGYDAMGRVVTKASCIDYACGTDRFDQYYTYDLAGNPTSYDHGFIATHNAYLGGQHTAYDAAGRISWVGSTGFGPSPIDLFGNAVYSAVGLVDADLGNGLHENRKYDSRLRPIWVDVTGGPNATPGTRYNFNIGNGAGRYDTNGNPLDVWDSINGHWFYQYDSLNRLQSAQNQTAGNALSWTYDSFGNRKTQTVTAGSGTSSSLNFPDANNRQDTGCFNAAGYLLGSGPNDCTEFTYDAEGRIATAAHGGIRYLYDAEGQRVAKYNGSSLSSAYLFDLSGHEITELDAGWNPVRREVYAGARHLATYNSQGSLFFVHSDFLGTERVRTDSVGNTCWTASNQPFGDNAQSSGNCGVSPKFFTGKERDAESGLDYFGARYMSSTLGRFMSPDWAAKAEPVPYASLDNPQSLNLYTYVLNNPVSSVDADGHMQAFGWDTSGSDCTGTGSGFLNCQARSADWGLAAPPVNVNHNGNDPNYSVTVHTGGCQLSDPVCKINYEMVTGHFQLTGPPIVQAPIIAKPKSAARQSCEANEVAYANRVQSDQHAGAGGRILKAGGVSAVTTAVALGRVGFAGGEFLEPIGGGIPGAAVGGFVGAVAGGASGILTTAAKEAGTGFLENHSILGYGNTYQKTLNANIQKHCGGL